MILFSPFQSAFKGTKTYRNDVEMLKNIDKYLRESFRKKKINYVTTIQKICNRKLNCIFATLKFLHNHLN